MRNPLEIFTSSIQLLETGLFQGWRIGIAGHPDGSPDISDKDLEKAMIDKKALCRLYNYAVVFGR